MNFSNQPYALKNEAEVSKRLEMLSLPHIRPLTSFLTEIKRSQDPSFDIPSFDPCDGGVNARILVLLEAPGPKAVGSTFVSRNNPDKTAENLNMLFKDSGIDREDTIIWNVIPWYIGDKNKIRSANKTDISKAKLYLEQLLRLLKNLDVVILMGKHAQTVELEIKSLTHNVLILKSSHPSPRNFNFRPEKRLEALCTFREALSHIQYVAPNNYCQKQPTTSDIDDLIDFLPKLYPNDPIQLDSNGNIIWPYAGYDIVAKSFFELALSECWQDYDFDSVAALEMVRDKNAVAQASLSEIKALLSVSIRGERWADGFRDSLILEGHIRNILIRLSELKSTQ